MFVRAASEDRPYHLGSFPEEVLPRDLRVRRDEAARPTSARVLAYTSSRGPFGSAVRRYHELFADLADGKIADRKAPVPEDLQRRSIDIKGGGYFLNAAQVGICRIPENAWLKGAEALPHNHAVVALVEHGRTPEVDNLACGWIAGSERAAAELRAAEIACCLAGHVRWMGFAARAHGAGQTALDF